MPTLSEASWAQFFASLGAVAPVVLFLLKLHHDVIHKVLPKAFCRVEEELRLNRIASEKVAEEMIHLQYHRKQPRKRKKKPKAQGKTKAKV